MSGRTMGKNFARQGAALIMLAFASMTLVSCGQKKTAASNVVEMRDMEVVDGTTNDDMTDLDAVRTNGVGTGNSTGNSATPPSKAPGTEKPAADAEAVPSE